jgi:hypothetical protein
MKKKLTKSSLVVMAVALLITFLQISCTKEVPTTPAALTKTQILIQASWKVDQLHSVINGKYASYTSGGSNTTGVNYNNILYTFNADGTGIYIDEVGTSHTSTWSFASADNRSIKFTINTVSGPSVNNWVLVEIADKYMHITQNFTVNGNTNCLQSYRLIQGAVAVK